MSKTTSVSHSYDVICVLNIFYLHWDERENKKPWKLARVQNSAISEQDIETRHGHVPVKDQVRFINHDFHCHTERIKDACHIRLYPYNESRDNRIEIPETWMQNIENYNNRSETKPNYTGETSNRQNYNEDRNAPTKARWDTPILKYQGKEL